MSAFAIYYKPVSACGCWTRYDLSGPLDFPTSKAAQADARKAAKLSINGKVAVQQVAATR